MTRMEAEDYVYQSYMRAEKQQDFFASDKEKRNPQLSKSILESKSGTPCVIITGSKGKGSMSSMISQILQSQIKVGMMTSPHLIDFCERFQINGKCISDDDFAKYMDSVQADFASREVTLSGGDYISPIAIQAALALEYFNASKTDFNVFECGKGAKYDDVCNIQHPYAIIGSIFLEHTRELGATIEEIALDKSCVIDGTQKCVYIASQEESVEKILLQKAQMLQIPVRYYGRDFEAVNIRYTIEGMLFDVRVEDIIYKDIRVPLLGEHQAKNCALAMALCQEILGNLNVDVVKRQLVTLCWPGRMEILSSEPFVMLDACINRTSCENVKKVLEYLKIEQYNLIVGIPDDKDYLGVVQSLARQADKIILTRSQNAHYVFSQNQKTLLAERQIDADWTNSIEEALELVRGEETPVLILGTTSLVSEVKKLQSKGALGYEL